MAASAMLKTASVGEAPQRAAPDAIRLDTLPDIARKLRRTMESMGANHFAACFVTPRGERRRIIPCLDAHYPGIAEETKLLAMLLGDRFARRMTASSVPMWWSHTSVIVPPNAFAERMEAPAGSASGVALPVSAEHGPEGVILFTGPAIDLSSDGLCETHAACVGLFAVIAKLKPLSGAAASSISKRELECLMLTASGLTSEEIAERLGLSVHTANQYLTNTTRKLNAVNRTQAVAKAMRLGLFD
ncbi:MAG: autoinducer binding domain-containing protein [Rhizobiaceae bacterium]|nr:autoinducer binding domain-containing protein [Rhizobiaceae bacterium]